MYFTLSLALCGGVASNKFDKSVNTLSSWSSLNQTQAKPSVETCQKAVSVPLTIAYKHKYML